MLSLVVRFHFEREMYFIQESFENATVVIVKEGSNDIPVMVAIETQSLEAKGQGIYTCNPIA